MKTAKEREATFRRELAELLQRYGAERRGEGRRREGLAEAPQAIISAVPSTVC